jgi:hypothetical protein
MWTISGKHHLGWCNPCFQLKALAPLSGASHSYTTASIVRDSTQYVGDQQLITDSSSRKLIQKVVNGQPLLIREGLESTLSGKDGLEEGKGIQGRKPSKQNQELLERLESIPLAVSRLAGTNPPLSAQFDRHFGNMAVAQKTVPPDVYK